MQPCNRIYYSKIYWRFNMFRAGTGNPVPTQPGQRPVTTCVYKPESADTVWSSWWWEVCRSKHVEPSINFGIIISITWLHLVGCFYWFILRCTDPWILSSETYVSLFVKCLLFLSDFNRVWILPTGISKNPLNIKFHENPASRCRFVLFRRTGQRSHWSLFAALRTRIKTGPCYIIALKLINP